MLYHWSFFAPCENMRRTFTFFQGCRKRPVLRNGLVFVQLTGFSDGIRTIPKWNKKQKKTHAEIIRGCSKRQSESEYFENNLACIVV